LEWNLSFFEEEAKKLFAVVNTNRNAHHEREEKNTCLMVVLSVGMKKNEKEIIQQRTRKDLCRPVLDEVVNIHADCLAVFLDLHQNVQTRLVTISFCRHGQDKPNEQLSYRLPFSFYTFQL
jgi:hypothetical protein